MKLFCGLYNLHLFPLLLMLLILLSVIGQWLTKAASSSSSSSGRPPPPRPPTSPSSRRERNEPVAAAVGESDDEEDGDGDEHNGHDEEEEGLEDELGRLFFEEPEDESAHVKRRRAEQEALEILGRLLVEGTRWPESVAGIVAGRLRAALFRGGGLSSTNGSRALQLAHMRRLTEMPDANGAKVRRLDALFRDGPDDGKVFEQLGQHATAAASRAQV